ncbi:fungal-specific transcription factor domain-containing protein [Tricharina praecox]|uniref:fungal-specific transcription factor domain-containing protein n=1 Tax=Tricharina praecox TaxID=43433 RepID=UPI002220C446|nr:fungal-specific transcription factor domain-containing protein [Tricharina praecox]KAI5858676.1 fungal-specific transcription factor domain-containing protein [Tricharina praecox]
MSTSDTGPAQKRLRVSRACEQCRSKKIKCDGTQPICSPCTLLSLRCTYGASPKKRGLAPGSVSALERTVKLLQRVLGLLVVTVKGADHALVALAQQHSAHLFSDDDNGKRLTVAWKEGIVLAALDSFQATGFGHSEAPDLPSEVEPLRADLDLRTARFRVDCTPTADGPTAYDGGRSQAPPAPRNETMERQFVGPSMDVEGTGGEGTMFRSNENENEQLAHSYAGSTPNDGYEPPPDQHLSPVPPSPSPATTAAAAANHFHNNTNFRPHGYDQSPSHHCPSVMASPAVSSDMYTEDLMLQNQLPEPTHIPPNSRILLDVYFSYCHCWYPILDKYDIVRLLHHINAPPPPKSLDPCAPSQVDSGKRALLYAVLSLASSQMEGLARHGGEATSPDEMIATTSARLYASSQKLLFESREYGMEHVQCLLILALLNISQLHLSTAWLLVGHAGRVSQDIGLNLTDQPFGRRTWLGFLVLESLIAFWLGREPQITDDDWRVLPVSEDGWEEWDLWNGSSLFEVRTAGHVEHEPAHITSVFNQLVKLVQIVRLIASLSSQTAQQYLDADGRQTDLLQRLRVWARELPSSCSLRASYSDMQPSKTSIPHVSNLHLLYLQALLRLHQPPLIDLRGMFDDEPIRAVKQAAISSAASIFEAYKSHRSFASAPCTFIHCAAFISNDPMARDDSRIPGENPTARVAKIFNEDLLKFCTVEGFTPGKALLRAFNTEGSAIHTSHIAMSRMDERIISRPMSIQSPYLPENNPVNPSTGSMMQDMYSPSAPIRTAELQERPIQRQTLAMSLREEDLNASNIATQNSTSMFFSKPSPGTLDDEFGMFDLPWAHNGIPEFMQNLGYIGFSPETSMDMQHQQSTPHGQGQGQGLVEGQNVSMGGVGEDDTSGHNSNIYAGRGLNTVLEQYLGEMLGAGNGNGSGSGNGSGNGGGNGNGGNG